MTDIATSLDDIAAAYDRQDSGAYLDVRHPVTGDPIGLRILVAGYEGERMKAFARERMDERLKYPKRFNNVTAASIERQNDQTIAHSILTWEWAPGVTFNGSQPEANAEGVSEVFAKLPFIAAQVDAFAANLKNYVDAVEADRQPA